MISALDGSEWSAWRPGRFIPRETASNTHLIAGSVGPRAVLDAVVRRKIPSSRRQSNPRTPIVQPVARHYTDWAITALTERFYLILNLIKPTHLKFNLNVSIQSGGSRGSKCGFWTVTVRPWVGCKTRVKRQQVTASAGSHETTLRDVWYLNTDPRVCHVAHSVPTTLWIPPACNLYLGGDEDKFFSHLQVASQRNLYRHVPYWIL
jgi:hypothetical protein